MPAREERDRAWFRARSVDRDAGYGTPCWAWTGYVDKCGYGRVGPRRREKTSTLAHRVAWVAQRGAVPEGYEIHHECENRACVNVAHMRVLPIVVHRKLKKEAHTHCVNGHEYTPENSGRNGLGVRTCKACQEAWNAERRRRRAFAA
jgi:hypothetical protein